MDTIYSDVKNATRFIGGKPVEWESIQRRTYDIVNVLVALGCVERLKDKQIVYKGYDEIERDETAFRRVLNKVLNC